MDTPHISPRSRQCGAKFQRLCFALSSRPHYESELLSAKNSSERFSVWAENLGAYHEPNDHRSADYRLREATSIARLIVQYLDELLEALDDAADIADGTRLDASLVDNPNQVLGSDEDDRPDTESTELGEICAIASDVVRDLLKISVLIRQSTDRDRYAKAATSGDPFLRDIDIRRIGEKFPKIADKGRPDVQSIEDEDHDSADRRQEDQQDEYAWLRDRLGNANVQRRQFLRYAKYHQNRIANTSAAPQAPKMLSASNQPALNLTPRPPSHTPSSRPTLAPTDSSTINVAKLPEDLLLSVLEQASDADDSLSFVSSQSPIENEDAEHKLRVIGLADASNGHLQFECPYCRAIIQPGTRSKWKKHVFSDIRAYVCTFQDCSAGLFEDRQEWFRHELECHRRRWICQVCSHNFSRSHDLEAHLRKEHSDRLPTDSMLGSMVAASSRPMVALQPSDCPLCDEWSKEKREQANEEGIPEQQVIAVRPDEFRRHLGEHMEQIALFAIPPTLDAQSISGSADGGNKRENAMATITRWQHGTHEVDKVEPPSDDSRSVASSNESLTSTGESHRGVSNLDMLVNMGFDRERASIAVKKGGDLKGAIDWLDKSPDKSLLEAGKRRALWHYALNVIRDRQVSSERGIARHNIREPAWLKLRGPTSRWLADHAGTRRLGDWCSDWLNGRCWVFVYVGDQTLSVSAVIRLRGEAAPVIWCFRGLNRVEWMYKTMLAQLLSHRPEALASLRILHHGWDFDLQSVAEFRAAFLAVLHEAIGVVFLFLGDLTIQGPDGDDFLAFIQKLEATGRVRILVTCGRDEQNFPTGTLNFLPQGGCQCLDEDTAWATFSFVTVAMPFVRAIRVRNRWLARLKRNKLSKAPYEKVSVLLISWAPEHDELHTEPEVLRLQTVLQQNFRFQVTRVRLKPKLAMRGLLAALSALVADNDAQRSLLVVYYTGHIYVGRGSVPGDIELTASENDANNGVSWSTVESTILSCCYADSLLIFDCSHAGILCDTQTHHAESSVRYQILAACGEKESTRSPGKNSFTNALIWALENLAEEETTFTTSQLRLRLMECPEFPTEQIPVLSASGTGDLVGDVVLSPCIPNEDGQRVFVAPRRIPFEDRIRPWVRARLLRSPDWLESSDHSGYAQQLNRFSRRMRILGNWHEQWLAGHPSLLFCWGQQARSLATILSRPDPDKSGRRIKICYSGGVELSSALSLSRVILAQLLRDWSTKRRQLQLLHHIWGFDFRSAKDFESAILALMPLFDRVCLILDSPDEAKLPDTLSLLQRLAQTGNFRVLITMEESMYNFGNYGFQELDPHTAISGSCPPVHAVATLFVVIIRAKKMNQKGKQSGGKSAVTGDVIRAKTSGPDYLIDHPSSSEIGDSDRAEIGDSDRAEIGDSDRSDIGDSDSSEARAVIRRRDRDARDTYSNRSRRRPSVSSKGLSTETKPSSLSSVTDYSRVIIEGPNGRRTAYLSDEQQSDLIRQYQRQILEDKIEQDRIRKEQVEAYQKEQTGETYDLTAENISSNIKSASHGSRRRQRGVESGSKISQDDGIKIESDGTVLHIYGDAKIEMRPGEDGGPAHFVIGRSTGKDSNYAESSEGRRGRSTRPRRPKQITEEAPYEPGL